jgi:pSer/pThr/pTyr-binding forkhead associated (FHA) protein
VNLDVLLLALRLLAALTLYVFVGGVAYVLWRDLRAASLYSQQIPSAYLVVEGLPEESCRFTLQEENIIGRAAENTIPIVDETVSTRHARLAFYKGQWLLEDLGSRNGTQVNDIPVNGPMVLTDGDRIQLGKVVAGFETSPCGSETEASGKAV